MNYNCQNCGSTSHCGVPLKREERDGDNRIIEIEVCKHCRCYNCATKTDWG